MKIGDTFYSEVFIDKYRSIYFAGVTGDFNPIHLDDEYAIQMGLEGAVLHGLCSLSFVSNSITDWIGDYKKLKKLKCKFSETVKAGDMIRITGKITTIIDRIVKIELDVRNQNDIKILKKAAAEIEI